MLGMKKKGEVLQFPGGKQISIDLSDDELARLKDYDEQLTVLNNSLGFLRLDFLRKERELIFGTSNGKRIGFNTLQANLEIEVKQILKKNKINGGIVKPPIDYENKKLTIIATQIPKHLIKEEPSKSKEELKDVLEKTNGEADKTSESKGD